MGIVAIKNVKNEVWQRFKSDSARHGLKMGEFFEKLVSEHEENEIEASWEEILKGKPLITKSEAMELKNCTKEFRKGFEFRL